MSISQKEQPDDEQFFNLIRSLSPGSIFNSYKHLCEHLQIEPIGGNTKKAIIAELTRYCIWKNEGNKFIFTEIYDSPLPKIDEKFLSSKYYSKCGYLLLAFLAEKYSLDENKKFHYLTKREIMGIISICNKYYSDAYSNSKSIEEESNKDSESKYFMEEASSYLYKLTQRILDSLQARNFLTFDKVTMVKYMSEEVHEATDEEARPLNEYYGVILQKYSLKSINAIRLRNDKKEIYKDIDEHLGFKHYEAIKFNLTAHLAINAERLRTEASLSDSCGSIVNSLVCSNIYNLIFDGIAKINPHLKYECIDEHLDKKIEEFIKNGAHISPPKFIKQRHFNFDVNIVKSRIESLIKTFIRIDDEECKHEAHQ